MMTKWVQEQQSKLKQLVVEIQELKQYSESESKFHTWEKILLLGIGCLALGSMTVSQEQEALADSMIRLHVVANSNEEADQALKLQVRDAVLAEAEQFYQEGMSQAEAEALFQAQLPHLQAVGQSVAEGYEVTVDLEQLWFPRKEYDYFALPAGEYLALHLEIGEAEGENWWCVAYPPLCLGAVSETVDMAVEAGNFSPAQGELITGEGYVLKFQCMELLGMWKQWLMD